MAVFSDFRLGIAQLEVKESNEGRYRDALDRAHIWADQAGCDALIATCNDVGNAKPLLIACSDATIDGDGEHAVLRSGEKQAAIAIGTQNEEADLSILCDWEPWTMRNDGASISNSKGNLILARPVGMTNAGHKVLVYDGGSTAWSNGSTVACLHDRFEPEHAVIGEDRRADCSMSFEEKTLNGLAKTIMRFDEEILGGTMKWVIGLSGGLDSSIVASLLVMSLGPERVVGYNLATRNNKDATRTNADNIAEALGIENRKGSIEDVVKATRVCAKEYGYEYDRTEGIVLENIQARVRGHMLSTFAAIVGGVVANNGNRIEEALGYATLYGDAIGALAPIGDLSKVEEFALARFINGRFGREVVPGNLLPKETDDGLIWNVAPSAELASGQVDPMKWFYHDWLVSELIDRCNCDPLPIMESYRSGELADGPLGKWIRFYGLDDPRAFVEDLEWVLNSMSRSAFKRVQAPPTITIASTATVHGKEPSQGALTLPEGYDDMRRALFEMQNIL